MDKITPGKPHCLIALEPPCAVYRGSIITAAKDRHNTLIEVMERTPKKVSVLSGVEYSAYDYFAKGIVLAIIGLVLNMIVLAIYLMYNSLEVKPKDKRHKKEGPKK